jgi:hypothetical protein
MVELYTVSTASDVVDANDGVLSLREAVTASNTDNDISRIEFTAALSDQTILLNGILRVEQDNPLTPITISGQGLTNHFIVERNGQPGWKICI